MTKASQVSLFHIVMIVRVVNELVRYQLHKQAGRQFQVHQVCINNWLNTNE